MSNYFDTIVAERFRIRGLGPQFNGFDRFFQSREEALEAVATNDYKPTAGLLNSVLIAGEPEAIQFYSFDLLDFVPLPDFRAAGNQSNKYIDLDGVNDYIGFSNADAVLDFTQDWTIGVTLVGVTPPSSTAKMTLFSRGGVHITLQASAASTNWGLYVTSDDNLFNTTSRAQANTWYRPYDFSRLLFVYCSTTKRLQYYIGDPATGNYAMRANLAIPQSMINSQNIAGGLQIGNGWSGTGGANFSGINWDGGVNNLIGSGLKFTGPFIQEYFQNQSNDPENPDAFFTQAEFYPDLSFYCKLGEDAYPTVIDSKGTLTDGELYNGAPDDFKDIPTS
jgi:hypothetical protein